jgi:hypothetical protein
LSFYKLFLNIGKQIYFNFLFPAKEISFKFNAFSYKADWKSKIDVSLSNKLSDKSKNFKVNSSLSRNLPKSFNFSSFIPHPYKFNFSKNFIFFKLFNKIIKFFTPKLLLEKSNPKIFY